MTYEVAGEVFHTKKALTERVRGILGSCALNTFLNADDFRFVRALLDRHPSAARKIGAGVRGIKVLINPKWNTSRAFWLYRVDGTDTDFSYVECITPTPKSKKFVCACREAVERSIIEFKKAHFNARGGKDVCPVFGEPLSFMGSHVDHKAPKTFEWLVAEFIRLRGIDVSSVELAGEEDGSCRDRFADPVLSEDFRAWHDANADLWVVSARANLGVLRTKGRA